MKYWKGFSFFFIYPCTMIFVGFLGGVTFMNYFDKSNDPGGIENVQDSEEDSGWQKVQGTVVSPGVDLEDTDKQEGQKNNEELAAGKESEPDSSEGAFGEKSGNAQEVASFGERLNADTVYVLEETDLRDQTVVETTWNLPEMYIGMNREQFISAMASYELSPPLSELERGFVSLEVLSFSQEKVVVQMNYAYVQPSNSFYLVVEDNYIVVYLEDRESVYMYTDINLTELPDAIQQDVINWMYVPDEESLYDFLESYSS